MQRELIPYYLTRGALAALLGWLIAKDSGNLWFGLGVGLLIFFASLWYAHSGWYLVNPENPLFPLSRDDRGKHIRNVSAAAGLAVAGLVYLVLRLTGLAAPLPVDAAGLAFSAGILAYMIVSVWQHAHVS